MSSSRQGGSRGSLPDDSEIDLGELYADDDSEIDFDDGLPDRASRADGGEVGRSRRPRARAHKGIPMGQGRYRGEIDFDDGLPDRSARVQIVKGAALELEEVVLVELDDEDEGPVPVRVHLIGGEVETRVDTFKATKPPAPAPTNATAKPTAPASAPAKPPPKAAKQAPHVHTANVGGVAAVTSADVSGPGQPHAHTIKGVRTSTDPGGPGHTHTFQIGGVKVKTGPPASPKGAKKTANKATKQDPASVQTLIFSKDRFKTAAAARKWAKDNDFRSDKVDETEESFRLRQKDPGAFQDGSFRTITLTDGVKAVVGRAKSAKVTPKAKTPPVKKNLPPVLSWEAVRRGAMPKEGSGSGLPKSLEADVPPAFRFWKCSDRADARAVRDALVESGLFTKDTIRIVNDVPRRAVLEVVEKLYLSPPYDDEEPVEIPEPVRPIDKAAALLAATETAVPTVLFDSAIVEVVGLDTILAKAAAMRGDYLIEAPDTAEVRKAIGGPCFRLMSRDDLVFATSAKLDTEAVVEWVQEDRISEVLKATFAEGRQIRLIKVDEAEERIVFGVVLEPNEVDAQNDTISEEEIRQAAHKFMEDFGNLGLQHKEIVNGKLVLLETFIAPVPFEIDGEKVKKGSWLFKERVVDNALWAAVKKGDFTGFSIGGSAIRKPIE